MRKARARAALFVQDPPGKEAARALLRLRAVDGVGGDVQAVVGEPRQRETRLGVLCRATLMLGAHGLRVREMAAVCRACEDVSTRHWANVGCVADPGLVAKMRELERFGANAGLGGA